MTAPLNTASLVSDLRRWALFESARSAAVLTSAADALESTSRALREKEGECASLEERFAHLVAVKDVHADKRFEATERAETATRQRDEALAALKASEEALATISYHYDNQDMSHVDFRVMAATKAREALENGPSDLADATKKDPGTEQREAGR